MNHWEQIFLRENMQFVCFLSVSIRQKKRNHWSISEYSYLVWLSNVTYAWLIQFAIAIVTKNDKDFKNFKIFTEFSCENQRWAKNLEYSYSRIEYSYSRIEYSKSLREYIFEKFLRIWFPEISLNSISSFPKRTFKCLTHNSVTVLEMYFL